MVLFSWNIYGLSLHCHENERQALLDFRQGVIADPFNRLSSWVGQDCCKWQGVGCNNKTGNVVKLDLRNPFPSSDYLKVIEVNSSLLELEHLNYLDLSQNDFTGIKIPKFFGSFQKLKYLNLSFAMFGGTVPHDLGNLSMLQHLDLSGLNLSSMSSGSLSSSLPSLSGLVLSNCGLDEFPLFLSHANLSLSLVNLDLSNNSLKGSIPQALLNMTSLEHLDFSNNNLKGPQFPEWLQTQTTLMVLHMHNSNISDSLSNCYGNLSSLETLDLSYNQIYGKVPPLPRYVTILDLSNNRISGPIPKTIGHMIPFVEFLNLSNNSLNGSIPGSLCKMQNLVVLDLAFNTLSGTIPSSIGQLQKKLETLHLNNNKFHGEFPSALRNHTRLGILDLGANALSGEIPWWIGKDLVALQILSLRSNRFNGTIPPKVCDMGNLHILDVSCNNLSGTIPTCFRNLSGMLLFNGSISFGKMPENIGQLKRLESLDFSSNHLSGSIPPSISAISTLGTLNLSFNNLSGPIPTGSQLQTFENSSYIGNSELCGFPLQRKCFHDEQSHNDRKGQPEGDHLKINWFYIGIVSGFAVGNWGVCAVLLFKKTWRCAYFRFCDDIYDCLFVFVAVRVVRLKIKLKCSEVQD
ncbi:hypothetical protein IFM89_007384 [Coptis chinensis]|uniref:Leucine-rich repeat-containing N-terminal plant-type domain-containing protein n=1 Tax=Coptis chinensis TaxID=261450 RepID=A0A835IN28_9MAGN|nr:hypothetical protein IFM89_007384 [Coptis chinensis]